MWNVRFHQPLCLRPTELIELHSYTNTPYNRRRILKSITKAKLVAATHAIQSTNQE